MQIQNIRKGFEAIKCKFECFKRDLKQSNANSNVSKGIPSIWMQIQTIHKKFEAFESKFEPLKMAFECKFVQFERDSKHLNWNSNHFKGIRIIQIQISTTRKGFEALKLQFEPFEKGLKHSNAFSNHSKGIWTIRMQIRNTWKWF